MLSSRIECFQAQDSPELSYTAIVVVPDVWQRRTHAGGNFLQVQAFETNLLNDTPLIFTKLIQAAQNRCLVIGKTGRTGTVPRFVSRTLQVMSPQFEILQSIEAAVACILQNPVLHAAARRVELFGIPVDFE